MFLTFGLATFILLSAPADNVEEWKKKLESFKKPVLVTKKGYPQPFHSPNSYKYSLDDVCSACHPFFTGEQKIVDAAGRVEKFKARYSMK